MSAAIFDIDIEQGATYELVITLTDSTGAALDLTGHTFRGQVRKTPSDSVIQASFSFVIRSPETLGIVDATISAADTALIKLDKQNTPDFKSQKFVYDIESENGSLKVYRHLRGIANVTPETTR